MKRLVAIVLALGLVGLGAFWLITEPVTLPAEALAADYVADPVNGQTMLMAGGCISCHKTEGQDDRAKLGGGHPLASPFGTFYAPNISPDTTNGIGGWTELQFVNAMLRGVGARGEHLYPSFPYTSYQRMSVKDVRDLFAVLKTLPATPEANRPHDLPFPFGIRRTLGVWKFLFLDGKPFTPDTTKSAEWNRGAYLVEGPGHCAECHSPRNLIGGIDASRRLAGGPDPEGKGFVPNITPHADGIGAWSEAEIAELLSSGFTPEFDSVGSTMAAVVRNTAQLTPADRAAMATYLKAYPAIPGKAPTTR